MVLARKIKLIKVWLKTYMYIFSNIFKQIKTETVFIVNVSIRIVFVFCFHLWLKSTLTLCPLWLCCAAFFVAFAPLPGETVVQWVQQIFLARWQVWHLTAVSSVFIVLSALLAFLWNTLYQFFSTRLVTVRRAWCSLRCENCGVDCIVERCVCVCNLLMRCKSVSVLKRDKPRKSGEWEQAVTYKHFGLKYKIESLNECKC